MKIIPGSAQAIAIAWLDEEFKSSLEKHPAAGLKLYGIQPNIVGSVLPRCDELNDELLEAEYDTISTTYPCSYSHCARGNIFCFSEKARKAKKKALS